MTTIPVGQENSTSVDLYYEDHGAGSPVVLIHGYPLNGASWEKQITALLSAGHRVIAYDRRGFGKSSPPAIGYDYDTFAADLNALIVHLNLDDLALVGFGMGGGEVARYLGTYGSAQVSKAVFISAIVPFLLKAEDNLDGVEDSVFVGIEQAIVADRPAFLSNFLHDFYNVDVWGGKRVTEEAVRNSWNVAVAASPIAILDCVDTWGTDFRDDLERIDVPILVIHGDADRLVPFRVSGLRTHKTARDSKLVVIEEGPHGILWTHSEQVNPELVDFLR